LVDAVVIVVFVGGIVAVMFLMLVIGGRVVVETLVVVVVSSAGVTNIPLNNNNPIHMITPIINPAPNCIPPIFMIDMIIIYHKLINK
jgi:hypothetical protein